MIPQPIADAEPANFLDDHVASIQQTAADIVAATKAQVAQQMASNTQAADPAAL